MLSKWTGCTENCNTCSRHWSTERARFTCTTPGRTLRASASKVEQIGLRSSASSTIFTWPLAKWLPLLQASQQLFAGNMLLQPAGRRKCFPRAGRIPKHRFLCYRKRQTYFSLAKECVDCNGSYFDYMLYESAFIQFRLSPVNRYLSCCQFWQLRISSGHLRANVYGEWTPGTSRVGPWSSVCGTL